jgi:hypothetical protein
MAPVNKPAVAGNARAAARFAAIVLGILPGGTGTFAVDFLDSLGNVLAPPPNIVPQWVSSDPNAVVSASVDGMTASVTAATTVDPKATPSFSLTVGATLADGTAIQGTLTVPYDTAAAANPASLGIRQTS